jgi:cell shape-determining protein MreC
MKTLTKPSSRFVLAVLLAGAVVLVAVGPQAAGPLRKMAHYVIAPFGDPAMYVTAAFKGFVGRDGEGISTDEARRLQETNDRLYGAVVALGNEVRRLQVQRSTMEHLGFGPLKDFPCALIPARVVAGESLPYGQTRLINRGTGEGARRGAPVTTRELWTDRAKDLQGRWATIAGEALVGRLTESGAFSARVQLLTDRRFELRARIRRVINAEAPRKITVIEKGSAAERTLTRENNVSIDVMVQGDGVAGLVVKTVASQHNIRPGDWVFTRNDEAFLPATLRIGRVTAVGPDPDHPAFHTLKIKPFADIDALREVFIVVPEGDRLGGSRAGGGR